jgi:hypothetical protein
MEKETDYPIYLHTQLGSYRAIKLYTDFGFRLLSDTEIGNRNNDIDECLPLLKELMGNENYNTINITKANKEFLKIVDGKETNEF